MSPKELEILSEYAESLTAKGQPTTLEDLLEEFRGLKRPYFPNFVSELAFRLSDLSTPLEQCISDNY